MTVLENQFRNVPEYYPEMYLDGFTPEQIMYAAKRDMYAEYEARNSMPTFKLVSQVEVKK